MKGDVSEKIKQLEVEVFLLRDAYFQLERTTRDLNQAKANDEAMLASIGDGIIATDQKRKIVVVNKAAEAMLGFKAREMIGKKWPDLSPPLDEAGKVTPLGQTPIHGALKFGKITTMNGKPGELYYFVRKDKGKFPVASTVSPVVRDEKIVGVIVVFRDITKEKELDRAKDEFNSS